MIPPYPDDELPDDFGPIHGRGNGLEWIIGFVSNFVFLAALIGFLRYGLFGPRIDALLKPIVFLMAMLFSLCVIVIPREFGRFSQYVIGARVGCMSTFAVLFLIVVVAWTISLVNSDWLQ